MIGTPLGKDACVTGSEQALKGYPLEELRRIWQHISDMAYRGQRPRGQFHEVNGVEAVPALDIELICAARERFCGEIDGWHPICRQIEEAQLSRLDPGGDLVAIMASGHDLRFRWNGDPRALCKETL